MIKITKEEAANIYKENKYSSIYVVSYPNKLQINYVLVLEDSSTFDEQCDLENSFKFPAVLYTVLMEGSVEQTQEIIEKPIEFFTIETFDLFKSFIEKERLSYIGVK